MSRTVTFQGDGIMIRVCKLTVGLSITLSLLASGARAQFFFPGGYGNFGMSQWGANPSAGYMAGLGEFARGKGTYLVDKAKADAINVETMAKWNKALHARQQALREEQEKEAARRAEARNERLERINLRDGTTLNRLLAQIFDIDPTAVRSSKASAPISMRAIKAIPFDQDSEAISLCLDEMTNTSELPALLLAPQFAEERDTLHNAVHAALEEDTKGPVSKEAAKRIDDAVAGFRAKFIKQASRLEAGYNDALSYFNTTASLSRMLRDSGMRSFLEKLENNQERTIGDLIAFMDAYNLRFGRATTERQLDIYNRLVPALTATRDSVKAGNYRPSPPDRSGAGLRAAAKDAFAPMTWENLEAHAHGQ
jgi:hypothetical protein